MSRKQERKWRNKLEAAMSRAANGTATLQDVDFITRVRREAAGRDGYSGVTKALVEAAGSSSKSTTSSKTEDTGFRYHRNNNSTWWGRAKGSLSYDTHDKGPKPTKEDGVFCTTSSEVIKTCPIAKTPHILVPGSMWDCWHRLTEAFDTEWIALFFGKLDKDKDGDPAYIVTSFYFPPQTASGSHVDVPTGIKPKPGVIGAVHSHVNMGVFFSATDVDHSNWPVEIVINRAKDYKAVARHQLKCGEWAKNEATVYLIKPMMSEKVRASLEGAFKTGAVYEERNRKSNKAKSKVDDTEIAETTVTFPIVPTTPTTPTSIITVPPGINPEDEADVQGSLYRQRCNSYQVVNGIVDFCTRIADHPGKCRNNKEVYFEPVKPTSTSTTTKGEDTKVIDSQSPDDGSAVANNHDFLNHGDYCLECEGIGLIETVDLTAVVCPGCKGSGLTEAGKIKVEERGRERMID